MRYFSKMILFSKSTRAHILLHSSYQTQTLLLFRQVRCDYQVAGGASELMAEFERSGDEQVLSPGGGFYAFVEDFRGNAPRLIAAMSFSNEC